MIVQMHTSSLIHTHTTELKARATTTVLRNVRTGMLLHVAVCTPYHHRWITMIATTSTYYYEVLILLVVLYWVQNNRRFSSLRSIMSLYRCECFVGIGIMGCSAFFRIERCNRRWEPNMSGLHSEVDLIDNHWWNQAYERVLLNKLPSVLQYAH